MKTSPNFELIYGTRYGHYRSILNHFASKYVFLTQASNENSFYVFPAVLCFISCVETSLHDLELLMLRPDFYSEVSVHVMSSF